MHRNLNYIILFIIVAILVVSGIIFLVAYNRVLKPNTVTGNEEFLYFRIPTGSDYSDVLNILVSERIIKDTASFNWVALKKNYANHVKPGKYRISRSMNNNEIVNMLRSGRQEPVRLKRQSLSPQGRVAVVKRASAGTSPSCGTI